MRPRRVPATCYVMAASNYIASVPKLKGRDNYDEWVFAAQNFLVLEGMTGSIKKPEESDADAKMKAKLILTIDPSLYVHIRDVKTTHDLWEKLRSLFDDSGFTRRISLLRNLISIRLENCSSMTSYVTQVIETGQKLNGTGFAINDMWIGSLLLAGLPEKYAPMIMAIEHSGIKVTADAIKSKLLDMESTHDGSGNEVESAFATSKKWQHHKKSMATKCQNGGPMSAQKKTNVTVKCYRCKNVGHYRSQCPNISTNNPSSNTNTIRKQTNAFSAVFLTGSFSEMDWYVDSGASVHLTANKNWLSNVIEETNQEILVANKTTVPVQCSGDVQIVTMAGNSEFDVNIEGVFCVPSLTTNLLSVSQLINKGNTVKFTDVGCSIYNTQNVLVATATLTNGVYKLNMPKRPLLAAATVSGDIWHRRLGHVNSEYINKMKNAVEGMHLDEKVDISNSSCIVCCEGKQSRLPFTHKGTRSDELLSIVHTDICGPMETTSLGGSKYYILFVDDYSRMAFIYFIENKNEALKCFKEYKAVAENQLQKKIKILRSDNGLEFCNKEFDLFLNKSGILHQRSNPYTPEQNGLCERFNRTVVEKARCMLSDANLSKEFWAEASSTAVYLQNRTVAAALNYKTPYELWYGTKPDISHIRVFGSPVMVHTPKERRRKWDKKSRQCILMGYPDNVKGYRVYDAVTRKIKTSRDVIVMEKPSSSYTSITIEDHDTTILTPKAEVQDVDQVQDVSPNLPSPMCEFEDAEDHEEFLEEEHCVEHRSVRNRRPPARYGFGGACFSQNDSTELSLQEVLQGPEREQWLQAIREELLSFEENSAWELVDPPADGSIVQCKWVLKKKYEIDDKVRYRARLVAKGFTQKFGVDYDETFSPVVRHTTLRLLFALSVKLKFDISHLDVTTAFLNGDLDEVIYMQKPECFNNSDNGKVLKLKKAIYGLKQSSRMWYKKVDDCLTKSGYVRSNLEPCLYIKNKNNCQTIVALYVDDFFIFSNDTKETNCLKEMLKSNFKLKDLGQIRQCLGMRVNYDKERGTLTLDQERYVEQLLQKFKMTECKTACTPMEHKLNLDKIDKNCNKNLPYQQLIGSLLYLAVLTRPDISFAVGYLSQFNTCYTDEHWGHCKRILKYLKKTKGFGLTFHSRGNSELIGFVDADWGNSVSDRKSFTGFCFQLSGGLISWRSQKQKTIALSSTEAEYIGISECCKEAIYLRNLQSEITNTMYSVLVYNDNQSAQKLLTSNSFHNRSKHVDIRYHFCKEYIANKTIKVEYMPTEQMPADLLTKSLGSVKHFSLLEHLGIKNV